jgi:hypothetical protein
MFFYLIGGFMCKIYFIHKTLIFPQLYDICLKILLVSLHFGTLRAIIIMRDETKTLVVLGTKQKQEQTK